MTGNSRGELLLLAWVQPARVLMGFKFSVTPGRKAAGGLSLGPGT